MLLEETDTGWKPTSEAEKEAVWRQVDKLLTDPSFNRSKRYPSLLRFIVTHALDGDTDSLKERVLGIEVFGRRPDYDSTQDPIVRVTAAEIRKRMVRYYQDPVHQDELRLVLPAGSYVPRFEPPSAEIEEADVTLEARSSQYVPATTSPVSSIPNIPHAGKPHQNWLLVAGVIAAVVAISTAAFILLQRHKSPVDGFWGPVFGKGAPILICTADQDRDHGTLLDAVDPVPPATSKVGVAIMSADTLSPVVDLTSMLAARGAAHKVQTQARTTFSDLSKGPLVLVGAFNNFWTLQLTKSLRFHFANDPAFTQLWIGDTRNPESRKWKLDTGTSESAEDYALVARYFEPDTQQWTVVVAGLGSRSNIEALHFVLSPDLLAELDRQHIGDWRTKNLEIVLKNRVINGNAGPSVIEAVHVW
ncbi:MAG TPA: hypothetical protein VGE93_10780 [Bryobacteraceae bacterium]